MLSEQTHLRLADDVTFQSLGDDEQTVVLSLGSGYLYTCNQTTQAFLEAMGQGETFGRIVDALFEQYDVTRDELLADLAEMAEKLLDEKLIVVASPDP